MEFPASIVIGIVLVLSPLAEGTTVDASSVSAGGEAVSVSDRQDTTTDYFPGNPFVVSERPNTILPDSLGGKRLKGYAAIRLLFDSSGVIHSYNIMRFKATADKPKINVDYRYGEKQERKEVARYKKWLKGYVERVKVERVPEIPLPHPRNENPPKLFYLIISIDFNGHSHH